MFYYYLKKINLQFRFKLFKSLYITNTKKNYTSKLLRNFKRITVSKFTYRLLTFFYKIFHLTIFKDLNF